MNWIAWIETLPGCEQPRVKTTAEPRQTFTGSSQSMIAAAAPTFWQRFLK
jgi:hypothetical protein